MIQIYNCGSQLLELASLGSAMLRINEEEPLKILGNPFS